MSREIEECVEELKCELAAEFKKKKDDLKLLSNQHSNSPVLDPSSFSTSASTHISGLSNVDNPCMYGLEREQPKKMECTCNMKEMIGKSTSEDSVTVKISAGNEDNINSIPQGNVSEVELKIPVKNDKKVIEEADSTTPLVIHIVSSDDDDDGGEGEGDEETDETDYDSYDDTDPGTDETLSVTDEDDDLNSSKKAPITKTKQVTVSAIPVKLTKKSSQLTLSSTPKKKSPLVKRKTPAKKIPANNANRKRSTPMAIVKTKKKARVTKSVKH